LVEFSRCRGLVPRELWNPCNYSSSL
jgi:hypothetical protein